MSSSLAAVVRALANTPVAVPDEDRGGERDIAGARSEVEVFEADAERLYARKLVATVDMETPIGPLVIVASERPPAASAHGYAVAWIPTSPRTSPRRR